MDGGQEEDRDWVEKIRASGFSVSKVELVVASLEQLGIKLYPQSQAYQGTYKRSFYLRVQGEKVDSASMAIIRSQAEAFSIKVGINRCNPLAGDPADYYDVDFIPCFGGKRDVVRFILDKTGLSPDHALAFGDSGNDLAMLRSVSYGYLVANATQEAKTKHPQITKDAYADGILSVVHEFFGIV